MIIEWDPAKAVSNRRKHGVDFGDAVTALEDPLSTTYPDPDHSFDEHRFVTIGISARGRVLVVAHADRRGVRPPRERGSGLREAGSSAGFARALATSKLIRDHLESNGLGLPDCLFARLPVSKRPDRVDSGDPPAVGLFRLPRSAA